MARMDLGWVGSCMAAPFRLCTPAGWRWIEDATRDPVKRLQVRAVSAVLVLVYTFRVGVPW